MIRGRGGVGHRCAAEAGFVRKQTPGDAVTQRARDRAPRKAPGCGRSRERAVNDERQRVRDLPHVCRKYGETTDDVEYAHGGNQYLGDLANPPDPTKDHDGGQRDQDEAGHGRRHAGTRVKTVGNRVGLHHVAYPERRDRGQERKEPTQ